VISFPPTQAPHPTWRLIPYRFPPITAFENVASAADLEAEMELEGWTNDRLVAQRVARLPPSDWAYGTPNASTVMAAFLHAAPEGGRFNGPELGAWYAAASITTAVAKVAHHLRREAVARGKTELQRMFRAHSARLLGEDYQDLRGQQAAQPALYDGQSHAASQPFGEAVRTAGQSGIIYDSLRHQGGTNIVAYRPRQVVEVVQAYHYDLIVPLRGKIVARQVSEGA